MQVLSICLYYETLLVSHTVNLCIKFFKLTNSSKVHIEIVFKFQKTMKIVLIHLN